MFGAEIQYWRLEPEYWEPVIKQFASTGLKCVTTYVPWETHTIAPADAKHPGGIFDFHGKTDPKLNLMRYLALIEKYGLDLNFRAGPFECNEMRFGGCPGWVVNGDPNMMAWDNMNRTTKGYGGRSSQPSYMHPAYLKMVRGYFDAVDPIIIKHAKVNGGCVTLINLDNEISYIVQDSFLNSDYNPVNVRRGGFYHQFLAEKYGSAGKLPYNRKCRLIEDVEPPRAIPETMGRDIAWHLDWIEFKEWLMCRYIVTLRRMHESNGVTGITYMTNFNPHLPEGVPTRMPSFEKATGGLVGYDFYRGTFMSYSGYHSMARVLKLMNASLKYTWSAEFMSGTWQKILGSRVSDDHMRFMARCALSQGCKSIAWFMFHDRDSWGDCPCSNHGHARPSIDVLSETVDLCFNRIQGWDQLVPQMDCVVIYDLVQHRHTSVGDPMPCADNDNYVGKPEVAKVQAGVASKEYQGLFRLIEENGYQAGVCDIMHSDKPMKPYRLAFLPGDSMIEALANRALTKYVTAGGVLVLSGPWPELNEIGRPLKFLGRQRPRASAALQMFKVGKGKLIWHPGWLCLDDAEKESLASIGVMGKLLALHAGVPHVHIRPTKEFVYVAGVDPIREPRNLGTAVLQQSGRETILFVLNHYPEAVEFKVTFGRIQAKSLRNLMTGETITVSDSRAVVDVDRKCADIYRVITG